MLRLPPPVVLSYNEGATPGRRCDAGQGNPERGRQHNAICCKLFVPELRSERHITVSATRGLPGGGDLHAGQDHRQTLGGFLKANTSVLNSEAQLP